MLRCGVPSASPRPVGPTFGVGFFFFNFYVAGVDRLRLHRLRALRDSLLHGGLDCFVPLDGSRLHLLRRLRALYGDRLRDDLDYLALLGLCFRAPSRFPGVASPSSPSSWSLRCSTT